MKYFEMLWHAYAAAQNLMSKPSDAITQHSKQHCHKSQNTIRSKAKKVGTWTRHVFGWLPPLLGAILATPRPHIHQKRPYYFLRQSIPASWATGLPGTSWLRLKVRLLTLARCSLAGWTTPRKLRSCRGPRAAEASQWGSKLLIR